MDLYSQITDFEVKYTDQCTINELLYNILYPLTNKLKKYGIEFENYKFKFDLSKINQDSFIAKENITGMKFSCYGKTPFHDPKISLLKNYKKVITKKFDYPKKLDNINIINNILIDVFYFIGIDTSNEEIIEIQKEYLLGVKKYN